MTKERGEVIGTRIRRVLLLVLIVLVWRESGWALSLAITYALMSAESSWIVVRKHDAEFDALAQTKPF